MKNKLFSLLIAGFVVPTSLVLINAQAQAKSGAPTAIKAQTTAPAEIPERAATPGLESGAQSSGIPGAIDASSLCYTCGGDWPVFAGQVVGSGQAFERGGACSGNLVSGGGFSDTAPYLCSK